MRYSYFLSSLTSISSVDPHEIANVDMHTLLSTPHVDQEALVDSLREYLRPEIEALHGSYLQSRPGNSSDGNIEYSVHDSETLESSAFLDKVILELSMKVAEVEKDVKLLFGSRYE